MNEYIEKFHSIRSEAVALSKEMESLDARTESTHQVFRKQIEEVFNLWYKDLEKYKPLHSFYFLYGL